MFFKCVIFLSSILAALAHAQSNLPPCNTNSNLSTWNNCIATITTNDGQSYVGEVREGKRNGKGTEKFPNGDKYVGEFKDDAANGFGTHYMKNGDVYVGYWKENNYDGKGIFISKNGSATREGLWQDDKFIKSEKTNISLSNLEKPSPIENLYRTGGFWVEKKYKNEQCQNILNNEQFVTFFSYSPDKVLVAIRAGGKHPNINNPAADPRKVLNKNINVPIKVQISNSKPDPEFTVTEYLDQSRMVNFYRMSSNGTQYTRYRKTDCQNCAQAQIIATNQFEGPEVFNWCNGPITN